MAYPAVEDLIATLAERTRQHLKKRQIKNPVIVGIHTGGVWIARRLHAALDLTTELGQLDISFYRDDFTRVGMNPQVKPSHLPLNLDNEHILLVDDVLYTGRTIRAALNEIFDYGRPASISLIVLIDRDGRELPIQADVFGLRVELKPKEQVKLQGPEPLKLVTLTKHEAS